MDFIVVMSAPETGVDAPKIVSLSDVTAEDLLDADKLKEIRTRIMAVALYNAPYSSLDENLQDDAVLHMDSWEDIIDGWKLSPSDTDDMLDPEDYVIYPLNKIQHIQG